MQRVARAVAISTALATVGVAVSCSSRANPSKPPPPPPPSADDAAASAPDSLEHRAEIAVTAAHDSGATAQRSRPLSPLADSIAQYLVLDPSIERWFLAAGRGKRLLVDIGRTDTGLRTDRRRAAYREALAALSPVAVGDRLRVRGAWGAEDVLVTGFDAWNGRIVATIKGSPVLDSVVVASVRAHAPLIVSAQRTDSTAEPARDSCVRDSLSDDLRERAAFVRDSLEQALRDRELPAYERLVNTLHAVATQVVGCFGNGRRLALAVDLRAGANEWIRERAVLLDTLGDVTPLRVDDYRFKGHDFLAALDADGDGVDDIAARGLTDFAGGTVVLKLAAGNRLQRLVSGFAWESR
jgi:hypothetical protein